jgi:hypothetical protein
VPEGARRPLSEEPGSKQELDLSAEPLGPEQVQVAEITAADVQFSFGARKIFTLLAYGWITLGIVAWAVVIVVALSFWFRGQLGDLPDAIKWLLGSLIGTQSLGGLLTWQVLRYHFAQERTLNLAAGPSSSPR